MKRCREIFYNEWQQRKREDPINYKGLSKYYVGDASVLVLVCADPRTMMVYLTTRRPGDREKLFQASVASAVEQMMLVAASMGFGTVWVSVREEIKRNCEGYSMFRSDTTALGRAHRPCPLLAGRQTAQKNLRFHAL